jgi:hypothetical protein
MDSASEFLFNSCVHSLKAALPYPYNTPSSSSPPSEKARSEQADSALAFTAAFADVMVLISQREVLGRIWPLFEIFGDKTAVPMRAISAYLDPVIRGAMKKKEKKRLEKGDGKREDGEEEEELSLLDDLLNTTSGTYPCFPDMLLLEGLIFGT